MVAPPSDVSTAALWITFAHSFQIRTVAEIRVAHCLLRSLFFA
jgi:hypothetical protein